MAFPCRIWLKSECDGCGACMSSPDETEDEEDPFLDYDRDYDERI